MLENLGKTLLKLPNLLKLLNPTAKGLLNPQR